MTRDASLDEFLGGDDEEDEEDDAVHEDGDEAGAVGTTTEDGDVDGADVPDAGTEDDVPPEEAEWLPPAEVEPARSTYDWSPDGAACAACGATVEARWRDEPGLVCADCKGW